MALDIYMYNAWFGDCFRIENSGSNLLVDFGIHSKSTIPFGSRDDIHKIITNDILGSSQPTLLISHYHEDHVSGLIYMMSHITATGIPIFQKVYIPDIWNITGSPIIIVALLLEELLKHSKLSKKKGAVTLFDLMRFLCVNTGNVVPIKRGQYIEDNRYIALWPEPEYVSTYANSYLKSLEIGDIPDSLIMLADKLRALVWERTNMGEINESTQDFFLRLNVLEENFLELSDDPVVSIILEKMRSSEEECYLNHLGNNISIVFQNTEHKLGENLLFTGDLENEFLVRIAKNDDKKIQMHGSYDFIKIPHHGTKGGKDEHYFDFKPYDPKCYMISNGCMHGIKGDWRICKEYSNDINLKNVKVFCSNSNYCASNHGNRFMTCPCINKQFVFPNDFVKVK